MAVSNTLLLKKRVVEDWDEGNSLPESIHNSAVLIYFTHKKIISHKKK